MLHCMYCILGLNPDVHLGKSIEEIYGHMINMVRYFLYVIETYNGACKWYTSTTRWSA